MKPTPNPPHRLSLAFLASLMALLLAPAMARSADFALVSLRFSAEHPVPHFRLEGQIEPGDAARVEALIERHTRCAGPSCNTFDSGPRAVVSLASPGGNYRGGVALADLFASNAIATRVEAGDICESACALAFLGGTGFWPTGGVGAYPERALEPGGVLGFHSPSLDAEMLALAVQEGRVTQAMDITRQATADLIAVLNRYDIDRWILDRIIGMGPGEMWRVETVADLHAIRSRLPGFDPVLLGSGFAEQFENVCAALLSMYYGQPLRSLEPSIGYDSFELRGPQDLARATDMTGAPILLAGFDSHRPYVLSGCGLPAEAARSPVEEVHLYRWSGTDDHHEPILSFHNPMGGWAQLTNPGRRGVERLLAISPGDQDVSVLNHLLLAPDSRLDALPAAAITGIRANRALDPAARFPHHGRQWPVTLVSAFPASRVYAGHGLTVVEQIGSAALFDALLFEADYTEISYRWDGNNAAVRSGVDRGTDVTYYWVALRSGQQAATIRIEAPVMPADLTQAQRDAMTAIACSVDLNGARLGCYR